MIPKQTFRKIKDLMNDLNFIMNYNTSNKQMKENFEIPQSFQQRQKKLEDNL